MTTSSNYPDAQAAARQWAQHTSTRVRDVGPEFQLQRLAHPPGHLTSENVYQYRPEVAPNSIEIIYEWLRRGFQESPPIQFSTTLWLETRAKFNDILLAAVVAPAAADSVNFAPAAEAAFVTIIKAWQNATRSDDEAGAAEQQALGRILGSLFPGSGPSLTISGPQRYMLTGFAGELSRQLASMATTYRELLQLAREHDDMIDIRRPLHFGTLILFALIKSCQNLKTAIPELPDWSAYRLVDVAARVSHTLSRITVDRRPIELPELLQLVESVVVPSCEAFLNLDSMLALDESQPQPEAPFDWLAARLWVANCVTAHLITYQELPAVGRVGYARLADACARADSNWLAGQSGYSLNFRGHFEDAAGQRRQSWPQSLLITQSLRLARGLFREETYAVYGFPICAHVQAALMVEALWDLGLTPVTEPEIFPGMPQSGEVWGEPDRPNTWLLLWRRDSAGEFQITSFHLEDEDWAPTPRNIFNRAGWQRIWPATKPATQSVMVLNRRILQLRNTLPPEPPVH